MVVVMFAFMEEKTLTTLPAKSEAKSVMLLAKTAKSGEAKDEAMVSQYCAAATNNPSLMGMTE